MNIHIVFRKCSHPFIIHQIAGTKTQDNIKFYNNKNKLKIKNIIEINDKLRK